MSGLLSLIWALAMYQPAESSFLAQLQVVRYTSEGPAGVAISEVEVVWESPVAAQSWWMFFDACGMYASPCERVSIVGARVIRPSAAGVSCIVPESRSGVMCTTTRSPNGATTAVVELQMRSEFPLTRVDSSWLEVVQVRRDQYVWNGQVHGSAYSHFASAGFHDDGCQGAGCEIADDGDAGVRSLAPRARATISSRRFASFASWAGLDSRGELRLRR